MRPLRAFVEITRLDTAALAFLSVFVPTFSRTSRFAFSVTQALPVLLICMSTFVANDLDDFDRDIVNHPKRPLPSRRLSKGVATFTYFGCLAASLYATEHFVAEQLAFWYYSLIVLSISYGYVVDNAQSLKTVYVAFCSATPIAVVALAYPGDKSLRIIAAATLLASIGRETCMDIRDRAGDGISVMSRFSPVSLGTAAFALQAVALTVLAPVARTPAHVAVLGLMALTLWMAYRVWFRSNRKRLSIALMKLQFALGLVFLI